MYATPSPALPLYDTHTHTQTNPLTQFSLPSAHTLSLCALHRPVCLDFTSRSIHLFGDSRFGDRRGRAVCEPKAPTTADWAECNGCRRTFSLHLNPSSSSEAVPFRFFFLYLPFTFPCTCVRVCVCACVRVCVRERDRIGSIRLTQWSCILNVRGASRRLSLGSRSLKVSSLIGLTLTSAKGGGVEPERTGAGSL